MSERHQADDFEGQFVLPLPIRGTLEQGQYNRPVAEFAGTWTVLKRSKKGIWPNAIVDEGSGEFVIATYPVNHNVNEVDIVNDANLGMFFVVDTIQYDAYNWIEEDQYKKISFDELNVNQDFSVNDTPLLISTNPESKYGRAVALWRPPTQTLENMLHRTPFDHPKTLLEGANAVGRCLQLDRGDIPSRLSSNETRKTTGNPQRAKELHKKFFENE